MHIPRVVSKSDSNYWSGYYGHSTLGLTGLHICKPGNFTFTRPSLLLDMGNFDELVKVLER